jgi:hypothetical protein
MVTQPNKAEIRRLIKKLKQADLCCVECGCAYGCPTDGDSSMWEGVCHVCEKTSFVTETRDYGYLSAGMRRLQLQIKTNQDSK